MAKTPRPPANMSILFTSRRFFEAVRTPEPAVLTAGGRFPALVITDNIAPSVPQNLQATAVSSSQINLTWSASTDTGGSGLAGYRIYRDSGVTPIGTSSTNSFSDTGLAVSTQYTYRVTAYDNAGNESAQSAQASATTQSGSGTIYFSEDYTTLPLGNASLTSAWTSRGYTAIENSGSPSVVQVLARASLPGGLLADNNFPPTKQRAIRFTLSGNEVQARTLWEGFPNGVRTAWMSWWEYRDNNRKGGEKFCRLGNKLPNGNRGHDIIWTYGNVTGLTLIANSTQMFQYSERAFGNVFAPWPPGLYHFEIGLTLSNGTASDGSSEVWVNGVRVANATGLRMNRDATDAARNITLWDIGGWSSTGGGTEGSVTYPIVRDICALRIASSRQGVWSM